MFGYHSVGMAGSSGMRSGFLFDEIIAGDKARYARRLYAPLPSSTGDNVREPRKTYGKSRKPRSGDAGGPYQQDVFTRLDRLRTDASENSVMDQLARLQAIAALMQQRDQGPMPGEMLRVYAWEVEDAVKKIKKNVGRQEAE